jgi:hypothetical protein
MDRDNDGAQLLCQASQPGPEGTAHHHGNDSRHFEVDEEPVSLNVRFSARQQRLVQSKERVRRTARLTAPQTSRSFEPSIHMTGVSAGLPGLFIGRKTIRNDQPWNTVNQSP